MAIVLLYEIWIWVPIVSLRRLSLSTSQSTSNDW
jgi:hypothetical protein